MGSFEGKLNSPFDKLLARMLKVSRIHKMELDDVICAKPVLGKRRCGQQHSKHRRGWGIIQQLIGDGQSYSNFSAVVGRDRLATEISRQKTTSAEHPLKL